MVTHPQSQVPSPLQVAYPESDGKPMADNTVQFHRIVEVEQNLELLFADDPNVFIAGDLLWYPVEGRNDIATAPDAMVVFGRPKGDRGSYQQWREGNIPFQVVFEILSPSNTKRSMAEKLLFYERYGVEEYYIYDPDDRTWEGWLRSQDGLVAIDTMQDWVSPRLQIRFGASTAAMCLYYPNGDRFFTFLELKTRLDEERQRAETAEQQLAEMATLLQQYRQQFGDLPQA